NLVEPLLPVLAGWRDLLPQRYRIGITRDLHVRPVDREQLRRGRTIQIRIVQVPARIRSHRDRRRDRHLVGTASAAERDRTDQRTDLRQNGTWGKPTQRSHT